MSHTLTMHLKRLKMAAVIVSAPLLLARCGDAFMKQKVTNEAKGSFELATTADAAGNYTGTIDPNSTATQVLRAGSGELSGSAIALPPGALGINLNITIGSGETLASSDTTQQLGLGSNTATAAGPSVSFVPSQNVQATNPFTLSIPVSGTSLAFALANSDNENLVVMYKWMKVADGVTSYAIGIITRDQLTIGSKTVQFQTDKFGTFQLAVTQTKITEPVTKPTAEPPVLKADASNPLVGVWSQCYASGNGGYNTSSDTTTSSTSVPSAADITADIDQRAANFDANQAAKTLTSACTSVSTDQLKMIFMIHSPAGSSITNLTYSAYLGGTQKGTSQSVGISDSQQLNVSFYSTPFAYLTAAAGDKFYVEITTAGCHLGPFPTAKRAYASSCHDQTPIDIYCDGKTMADVYAYAIANAQNTTSTTSTTKDSSGGGGRDYLGIPLTVENISSREYVKFSNSTFIHSRSTFTAPNCTGSMINRIEETGSYKLGTANGDTMPISITFAGSTGAILMDAAVQFANRNPKIAGCGFSDWTVGNPKDLSSATYCSNADKSGKTSGPSIVKIKDNNIYFDDGGSGVLNTKDFMSRQQ